MDNCFIACTYGEGRWRRESVTERRDKKEKRVIEERKIRFFNFLKIFKRNKKVIEFLFLNILVFITNVIQPKINEVCAH